MDAGRRDAELFRQTLLRVLSSASFARSERLSALLRFLVECHLDGRDDELKESVIGVEVFGRAPDYDPKLDSTVRTEAVRLRARLSQYYSSEGIDDRVVIEVPKGAYVPRCRVRAAKERDATDRSLRWLPVGLIAALVIATAGSVGWMMVRTTSPSIAVVPLVNLTGDSHNDAFADGLTTEIIRQVSGISGLAVRSRTSSFSLKGNARTVRELGSLLHAEYIVEGSLAGREPDMRIAAELIRVRDDQALWTGTFDRRVRDALTIQQEISGAVANALKWKLGYGPRRYDPEAYDLYLRARAASEEVFAGDDDVINLFEQAIGKDASIGPAYAGLAVAYAFQSFQTALDQHRADKLEKMRAAASHAVGLDPQSAEALSARGIAYARDGQFKEAERSLRRAIEIDPSLSGTRDDYARFVLWPLGRMDEALRQARAALDNDPLSSHARNELADVLLAAGRYDEAARFCQSLPPDVVSMSECIGRARIAQGRTSEAIQILDSSSTSNWGYLAYAYAKAGRRPEAEALIAAAPVRYPNRLGPFQLALVFAGFEDKARTLEQLRRMAGVGPVRMGFTLNKPEFAFLHGDPDVVALRKQVGLPE